MHELYPSVAHYQPSLSHHHLQPYKPGPLASKGLHRLLEKGWGKQERQDTRPLFSTAALQAKVQWCREDQNYRQHLHGSHRLKRHLWTGYTTGIVSLSNQPYYRLPLVCLFISWTFFLCPHWPLMVDEPNYQDAERSCSHLGTMVEFAVALGSKLGVINKHSFNNFRLRVGEAPPLLGQYGTHTLQLLSPLQVPHQLFSSSSLDTPSLDLLLWLKRKAASPRAKRVTLSFPNPFSSNPKDSLIKPFHFP